MRTIAIVGRPNVGKSAFFNRLTESRKALVHNLPGVTRDRLYGEVTWLQETFTVIDTGGLEPGATDVVKNHIEEQVATAVAESDVIVFMVDGKSGIHPLDQFIAEYLRRHALGPVIVVVNKVDDIKHSGICADFYELGFDEVRWVSATHGLNIGELLDHLCGLLTTASSGTRDRATAPDPLADADARFVTADAVREFFDVDSDDDPATDEDDEFGRPLHSDHVPVELREDELLAGRAAGPLRVVIVGRPNVGKSSLINHLIQERRLIVDDVPGTTRGPVEVPFELGTRDVVLVDTAGIKKRDRKDSEITRICAAVSKGTIRQADICVLLLDASSGIVTQDKHVAGEVAEMGKACILAVNKWDIVEDKEAARKDWDEFINRQFRFLPHATTVFLSAKTGRGAKGLLDRVGLVADCCRTLIPTGRLNEMLREAQTVHPAPTRRSGRRLKIFYAVQLRNRPGTFALVVNDPTLVHFSFERFLENTLRRVTAFTGVPIKFLYRQRRQKRPHVRPRSTHPGGADAARFTKPGRRPSKGDRNERPARSTTDSARPPKPGRRPGGGRGKKGR